MFLFGIVIVGIGMIGVVYCCVVLLVGVEVCGVVVLLLQCVCEVVYVWNVLCVYCDIEDVVVDFQVQVVYICMFNYLYCVMVQVVLEVGKYVICEKLLVMMLDYVQVLVVLVVLIGLVVIVFFVYCYYLVVCEVCVCIVQGDLGLLYLIYGSYLQDWLLDLVSNNWWVDLVLGGILCVFVDIGLYWCDLVEWVSGECFVEVNVVFVMVIVECSVIIFQSFSMLVIDGVK